MTIILESQKKSLKSKKKSLKSKKSHLRVNENYLREKKPLNNHSRVVFYQCKLLTKEIRQKMDL